MKKTLVSLLAIGAMGAATLPLASPAGAAAVTSATVEEAADLVDLLDPAVYSSLSARQQRAVDELVERFGPEVVRDVEMPPVDTGLEEARANSGLMGWFGQELFAWGLDLGLGSGLDEVFHRLGFESNTHAMGDIHTSLPEFNNEFDDVVDDMRQRADTDVWDAFAAEHAKSKGAMDEMQALASDVTGLEWLNEWGGHTPPADDIQRIAESANQALVDLGSTLLSPMGTGTIPALVALETNVTPVSDTVEQWDRLYELVDHYRAAYAQGLTVMLWAAQFDDQHDSDWGTSARARVHEASEQMNTVYEYIGAPYPQHLTDVPWIHANGQEWALTNADRQPFRDEHMTIITEGFDHHLMTLVDNYRPTNGETLEQMFHNRSLNIGAIYADQIDYVRSECQIMCWYQARYLQGKIVGNQRIQERITFWDDWGYKTQKWIDSNVTPKLKQMRGIVEDNPDFALVHLPINPNTGMPALMDHESIRAARDGLKDLQIERGDVDDVMVAFDRGDYTTLMVVDPTTDEVLATSDLLDDPNPGWLRTLRTTAGIVELQLGYTVDGDPTVFDSRAVSTIATNPDTDNIHLRVTHT